MGIDSKSSKATARQVQSSLFIGSLSKELEKIANDNRALIKQASEYLEEGCSEVEARELLSIDGYSAAQITACLASLSAGEPVTASSKGNMFRWGFSVEDQFGRITTSAELNIEVEASCQSDATKKIAAILSDEYGGDDQILDVYKL